MYGSAVHGPGRVVLEPLYYALEFLGGIVEYSPPGRETMKQRRFWVCVVGHSASDYLGALPIFLWRGASCGRLITLSYFSLRAAARLVLDPEGPVAFLGRAAALAGLAVKTLGAGHRRVLAVVAWNDIARAELEKNGLRVARLGLPWFYRAMSPRVKARVELAARMLEALSPRRSMLASILERLLPELASMAGRPVEEVDPDSIGLRVAREIEERIPVDRRDWNTMVMDAVRPAMLGERGGFKLFRAETVGPRSLPLMLPAARLLLRQHGGPVIIFRPGPGYYMVAGASTARDAWSTSLLARAHRLFDSMDGLAISPTSVEGLARPGPVLAGHTLWSTIRAHR